MILSCLQLGVGVLYASFLWLAPDARPRPRVTRADVVRMLPVGVCAAGAHAGSVFALGAGAVSFAQIVKAAEPAFAAVIGTLFYGASISTAKWLALVPVIGGVTLASATELSFCWSALASAAVANCFAAFKGQETKRLMEAPGLRDRVGSVGNQFALTSIIAFLASVPLAIAKEGHRWGEFVAAFHAYPAIKLNLLLSGLWFYAYNEVATMTMKKTSAVTQSVANTAKRVIVIVGVAAVMGEAMSKAKLLGCGVGIGGVLLYSIVDELVGKKKQGTGDTDAPAVSQIGAGTADAAQPQ